MTEGALKDTPAVSRSAGALGAPSWLQHLLRHRGTVAVYVILAGYALVALYPVLLIFINSFKERMDLFRYPYHPPLWLTWDGALEVFNVFSTSGYETVFGRSYLLNYVVNSVLVAAVSLALIILLSLMLAYALTEFRFRGSRLLYIYFVLGIMIPLQIGTSTIIGIMQSAGLYNTIWALTLIYVARGLPVALFIMSEFMRTVPVELKEAARMDGASEYRILFGIVAPLTRPAIATVLAFQLIPVWNDLWFPLTVAPGEAARTVTLGVANFAGQYRNDWSSLLAALSLAMIPVTVLFIIFSRQFVAGLTRGAVR
jgi:raffinose/stachyose/melibiose transport system permease protein